MHRNTKLSHQGITNKFVQETLLMKHRGSNRFEIAIQQTEKAFCIHHIATGRESHQIGKQHHTSLTPSAQAHPTLLP